MARKIFRQVQEGNNTYTLDYYVYTADFTTLAASGSQTSLINIEADADFVVEKLSYFAEIGGAPQTSDTRVIPLVKIAINDSGSGRNLQSNPVYLSQIAGDGQLPFVLPLPRVFRANSTINNTITNVSAATTYDNIQVAFIGYKKFLM